MAKADLDDEAEKPLDPATERLRRKMVRLLAVSVGVMMVAVMAVLAAVVYKIGRDRPAALDPNVPLKVELPAGAEVEDMAMGDGQALLRLRDGAAERLLRIDLATGRVVARYDLVKP
ncbi:hypothetical protein GCM10011390_11210 [Aureimonas endophytica]|uniref:Fimbrial protein n=1 Tax=Aureimonas endophytica TaxID=2027858 RepID=A0A916ZG85_9HYPH|nr:DUF6476 family protein [Aureimonas endophytica]GGD94235.1 hypothetical protein GCM10011390_11210 [Aureimonas endophytica]